MQATLVLTRSHVQALLGIDECIAAVETAFRLHAEGRSLSPGVLGISAREGGFPLAVMDSSEVTLSRTAAATAVAAKRLARPDSKAVTICGCGRQGRAQLRALARVLPLERAYAFDVEAAAASAFALELSAELGIDVTPAGDHAEAVRNSDVCVTCTPSRQPFLRCEHVRPGTFVAAVGADNPEKQELAAELTGAATLVVDVLDQSASIGELHHALDAGVMTREDVHAELADLIMGRKPGRRSAQEITIFDSTGTALEDVAAAAAVYEKAVAAGIGLRVPLGE